MKTKFETIYGKFQFNHWVTNEDRQHFLVYLKNDLGVEFKKYINDPENYQYDIPSQLLEEESIKPLQEAFTGKLAKEKHFFKYSNIYSMNHWSMKVESHMHHDISGKDLEDCIKPVYRNKVYDKIRHLFNSDEEASDFAAYLLDDGCAQADLRRILGYSKI